MAEVPMARERGYGPGRFSFNVAGGRCEACQGDGVVKVEMHFLPDVYVPCEVCHGQRYNRETLEVQYKGRNIAQILDMTVEHAAEFFSAVPTLHRKLQTLLDVGLSYIRWARAPPRSRAARRSASSWRRSSPSATPAARSTSWTSPPPACTSPTSSCC
jgi:excinuclease UvrABC ATPase subunit